MATKTIEMEVRNENGGYTALHPKTIAEYVNYSGDLSTSNLYTAMNMNESACDAVATNMGILVGKEENMVILKENVTVANSSWVSDSTYSDFPFKAVISIAESTNEHIPDIYFSLSDASSGIFSPLAEAKNGSVTIWATEKPGRTVTIPTIKLVTGIQGSTDIKFLSNIYVQTPPTKTTYKVGETLVLTGMVVKAVYTNMTEEVISTYTTNPERGTVLDDDTTEVVISYTYGGITKTVSQPLTVSPALPTDKTFSQLTDAEIVQLAQALQDGTITTSDLSWRVGDTRNVSLGSFTSYPSGSAETQAAQTAELVVMHVGSPGIKFTDGKNVNYVIGFKNCVAKSYYHSSNNTYSTSLLKTVENNIYNALPSTLKPAFKQFNAKTAANGNASSVTDYPVYMCSPAEKEVFGSSSYSVSAEANALTQFKWYETSNNRIKQLNGSNVMCWERSPRSGSNGAACVVDIVGAYWGNVAGAFGVSPFGCI